MSSHLKYKDYVGSIETSEEDDVFFGKLLGIRSLVSYEGSTCAELKESFQEAVDDYLASCAEEGIKPEVPYKGTFNVRVSPQLHERLALYALQEGRSMNSCVTEALESYVAAHT